MAGNDGKTLARCRPVMQLRILFVTLFCMLFTLYSTGNAIAQTGTIYLTSVAFDDGAGNETKVLFSFNHTIAPFSIEANNDERVVISFPTTVRSVGAGVPSTPHGLLRAVEFTQLGGDLRIVLVGTKPIHVEATIIAGRAVSLAITAVKGTVKDAVSTDAGPIPDHAEPSGDADSFEVVPLKYADVSEVVGLLSTGQQIRPNDNFTIQEPLFGSAGFNTTGNPGNTGGLGAPPFTQNAMEGANTAYGQSVDDAIGVDRRLNAIVLKGSAERISRLKAKISALDVPLQSVLLETIFVELTETGARNIGLDFNNANGQIAVATYQRANYAGNGAVSSVDVAGYGSYALQAAIYGQVSKGEGRIVSRPRISAQSGVSAKIVTGDALPIVTSIALSGVNAVSQQVQYVNVGVTLQIAPRVGLDGFVTSHIFAEVSTVTGYSQGYPTISQRAATTSATVRDGEYFIVGGLTQESHLKSRSRVPILGDLPVAGELFKLHQESGAKTELYIVVTPHIIHETDSEGARSETHK